MSDHHPPPHKSERMFRRYSAAIHEILTQWPNAVIFDPKPFSAETFSCRLRDAIDSVLHYKWPNSLPSNLVSAGPFVIVSTSLQPGKVVAGSKESLKLATEALSWSGITAPITKGLHIDQADGELVKAVIVLHHHRLLLEPTTLKTFVDVENMITGWDVFAEFDEGIWTIT